MAFISGAAHPIAPLRENQSGVPCRLGAASCRFAVRLGIPLLLVGIFFSLPFPISTVLGAEQKAAAPDQPEDAAKTEAAPESAAGQEEEGPWVYIREIRVEGAKILPREEVETVVYPFMGPDRTLKDIEAARGALEKAYRDKGYQTVSVNLPQQLGTGGIITLEVVEAPIGRLNVVGSRFFDTETIRKTVPSLQEGNVPDFNKVQKEIVALNKWPDRRVTPELRPGATPGTFDVDLKVEDTFPLHAKVEYNNRYTANTTKTRLDASVRYDNLWQLGHTAGVAAQVAPENFDDSEVYNAYYLARFGADAPVSLLLQGTIQKSDVATLGGGASLGEGEIIGGRLLFNLEGGPGFYHSANIGLDYKNLEQNLELDGEIVRTPVTYWPVSASYSAALFGEKFETELEASVTWASRRVGSTDLEFDNRRYESSGSFLYFRGSLAHTQKLPLDFQIFAEVQGQASNRPLVDSEQFTVGGLSTVRGYLEAAAVGDNAIAGTIELRSPSLLWWMPKGRDEEEINEWRIFAFVDAAYTQLKEPLPEQTADYRLWSYGAGTTIRLLDYLNASVVIGVPMMTIDTNLKNDPFVSFRFWAEL